MKLLLAIGLSLFVLAACEQKSTPSNTYTVRFGIVTPSSDGDYLVLKETYKIPRHYKNTGFRFGFEIVSNNDVPFNYKYIIDTPSPPKQVSGVLSESNEGKPTTILTSPTFEVSDRGTIYPIWFDEGDPLGHYKLTVIINGTFTKTFTFEVTDN